MDEGEEMRKTKKEKSPILPTMKQNHAILKRKSKDRISPYRWRPPIYASLKAVQNRTRY